MSFHVIHSLLSVSHCILQTLGHLLLRMCVRWMRNQCKGGRIMKILKLLFGVKTCLTLNRVLKLCKQEPMIKDLMLSSISNGKVSLDDTHYSLVLQEVCDDRQ